MKRFALGLAFCLTSSASAEWSQFNIVVRDYSLPSYEVNAPAYGIYPYNEPVWEPIMPTEAPAAIATPAVVTRLAQPRFTAADIARIKAHFAALRAREHAEYQAAVRSLADGR
jgi:hypothetical protein